MTVRMVALGELGRFVGGGTPSRKVPEYFAGQIPWATVKDFKSDRITSTLEHLSDAGLKNSSSRLVPKGSLLIVSRMALGKAAIAEMDVAINQDIKAFIPNGDQDIEFLLWCLKALAPEIERRGAGATVKGITLQDISSLPIPLPPIKEQRRIVDILNRAASIEQLKARASAHLRDFIPALFLKMFGDPIENPMGFKVRPLMEVTSELYRYPNYFGIEYIDTGVPEVRGELLLEDGSIDTSSEKQRYISDETSNRFPRTVLEAGDVVMTVRGTIGKLALVGAEFSGANITANLLRVAPDRSVLTGEYLMYALSASLGAIERLSSSTTIKTIKAAELKQLPILVPSIARQKDFTKLVEAAQAHARLCEKADNLAADLSRSLIDKLLGTDSATRADPEDDAPNALAV